MIRTLIKTLLIGKKDLNKITPREWMVFLHWRSREKLISLSKQLNTSPEEFMEFIISMQENKPATMLDGANSYEEHKNPPPI